MKIFGLRLTKRFLTERIKEPLIGFIIGSVFFINAIYLLAPKSMWRDLFNLYFVIVLLYLFIVSVGFITDISREIYKKKYNHSHLFFLKMLRGNSEYIDDMDLSNIKFDGNGEVRFIVIRKDNKIETPGITTEFLYSKGLIEFNKDKIRDYFINKRERD